MAYLIVGSYMIGSSAVNSILFFDLSGRKEAEIAYRDKVREECNLGSDEKIRITSIEEVLFPLSKSDLERILSIIPDFDGSY